MSHLSSASTCFLEEDDFGRITQPPHYEFKGLQKKVNAWMQKNSELIEEDRQIKLEEASRELSQVKKRNEKLELENSKMKSEIEWLQKTLELSSKSTQKEKVARKEFSTRGIQDYRYRKFWAKLSWKNAANALIWKNAAKQKDLTIKELIKKYSLAKKATNILPSSKETPKKSEKSLRQASSSNSLVNETSQTSLIRVKKLCLCGKNEFDTRNKVKQARLDKRLADYAAMEFEKREKYCAQCGREK